MLDYTTAQNLLDKYNISLTNIIVDKLIKYCDLLYNLSQKFNLTGLKSQGEIFEILIIQSLSALDLLSQNNNLKLIDIGTGAGIPGFVLGIALPEIKFHLLDSNQKKCEFLKNAAIALNLDNISVINDRCESLAKDEQYRGQFDFAAARALAELRVLIEYTFPLLKVGGRFICFKNKNDLDNELKSAQNALNILGGEIEEIIQKNNVDLVIIKKNINTPDKFPRAIGIALKRPL